jgi:spermidine/putrescine transport system ATP-binding protein
MRVELKTLQRETGITFVFVTHDQEEALTMSDRIAVIKDGEIQQIGRPEDIYENPSNQFVANFIGEVNLLSGVCLMEGENGSCKLDAGYDISLSIPRNVKKGDAVTVFIRPERIRINKSLSAKSLTSISGFTYLGNAAHIELISNKQIINATLPIDKVKNFKKGDLIEIEFPKDNAQVINK